MDVRGEGIDLHLVCFLCKGFPLCAAEIGAVGPDGGSRGRVARGVDIVGEARRKPGNVKIDRAG